MPTPIPPARSLALLLLANLALGCGPAASTPGTDGGAGEADGGGGVAADPKVRYLVSFVGSPPMARKAFSLQLDDTVISAAFDTTALGAPSQSDYPGRTAGWTSIPAGEHTVKATATVTVSICRDPPQCTVGGEVDQQYLASNTFTAVAGGHHLVFVELSQFVPAPRVPPEPRAQVDVFDVTPPASGAAVFIKRRAFSFRAIGVDYGWRPATNPCEGTGVITVNDGEHGTVAVPAATAGLVWLKAQDAQSPSFFEFPTLQEGELYTLFDSAWPPQLAPAEAGARTDATVTTPSCGQ